MATVELPPASDPGKKTVFIDGSQGEGGGQVLCNSISYAVILKKSIQIDNIRAGRSKPARFGKSASDGSSIGVSDMWGSFRGRPPQLTKNQIQSRRDKEEGNHGVDGSLLHWRHQDSWIYLSTASGCASVCTFWVDSGNKINTQRRHKCFYGASVRLLGPCVPAHTATMLSGPSDAY
jgi:hypothetical protein